MAKVCCSIEMEPRTLSEGQLSNAREAAVDVVQKMEEKEASSIFNKAQGLGPVAPIKEADQGEENEDEDEDGDEVADDRCIKAKIIELPCQCLCVNMDSPDQLVLKEPLSAPF